MPSEAEIVRLWAARGVALLKEHITELNSLNVFPVADKDTGTNMYLTFEAAQQSELSRHGARDDLGDSLSALARGAVAGACGNSGVILAEALIGVSDAITNGNYTITSLLQSAAMKARESVFEPQPGTMLTLFDSLAEFDSDNLEAIAERARHVLFETRNLLPELQRAGVVDAGGRGVVILLDALVQVFQGFDAESPPIGFVPVNIPDTPCLADREFELIFKTANVDMKQIQERIHTLGTSLTTTSDGEVTLIHIHTDEPKQVIKSIEEISRVWDIHIESLEPITAQVGCVVVVEGLGNVLHFVALGATAINALDVSSENIAQAILKANQQEVILLLHQAYEPIARQAIDSLSEFKLSVRIVDTASIVSTLAAFSVFDAGSDIDKNIEVMNSAMQAVNTIVVQNSDFSELDARQLASAELITIIWGEKAENEFKQHLIRYLTSARQGAEIDEISGDQQSSLAIVGIE